MTIDIDKYKGHTDGPWEWDDLHSTGEEKLFVHKKGDDNNLIAEVSGKINGKTECANAQLIADAPLLLQALIDERAEVKRLRKVLEDIRIDALVMMTEGVGVDAYSIMRRAEQVIRGEEE